MPITETTEESAEYSATLRIHSEIIDIETITKLLKIEPDKFLIKGSRAVPDNPKSYVYPSNMWRLDSDLEAIESFEAHITRLVEFIESRADVFKELSETCEFDIHCGYFSVNYTGYLSMSPDLLKRITIVPIKIIVRLYLPTESDN